MISYIEALSAGNAVRMNLNPLVGALRVRVLRKPVAEFGGAFDFDGDAVLVHESPLTEADEDIYMLIDTLALENGQTYFYQPYYYALDDVWHAAGVASVAVDASYMVGAVDVAEFVRNRIEAGLRVAIARGELRAPPDHADHIEVLAAFPQWEDVRFPMASVHVDRQAGAERFLGEDPSSDQYDPTDTQWDDTIGRLARWDLTIMGWALNPEIRAALRRHLNALLIANLPVFEAAAMQLVDWEFADMEELERYPAPVYQTVAKFNCIAPDTISGTLPAIADVHVQHIEG